MKKSPMIKSGFRTMLRYKLRTFFMMIGIVVGITALTLVISLGKGSEKKIMGNIRKLFSASDIIVMAGGGQMLSGRTPTGPVTTLTLEDLETIQAEISNINVWDPMQMISGREVKFKEKSANIRIFGHSPNAEQVWNRSVTSGEFFTEEDIRHSARVALLGTDVVEELFGADDPLDQQIRIGNAPFRVKGILTPMGMDPHGMNRDNEIWVPVTTAMRRLQNVDYIMSAKIRVKTTEGMENTADQIAEMLRERHHLVEGEPDDFHIITPVQVQKMVASATKVFNVFLPLIAGIALIVGAIVIANLMLITVNERTGEIGLRKAVGARSKDILLQFLMESTVVTLVGGIIGILFGILGVRVLTVMMNLPVVISWQALILGIVSSTVVGLAAGVFPARRAASFEPVATLR